GQLFRESLAELVMGERAPPASARLAGPAPHHARRAYAELGARLEDRARLQSLTVQEDRRRLGGALEADIGAVPSDRSLRPLQLLVADDRVLARAQARGF